MHNYQENYEPCKTKSASRVSRGTIDALVLREAYKEQRSSLIFKHCHHVATSCGHHLLSAFRGVEPRNQESMRTIRHFLPADWASEDMRRSTDCGQRKPTERQIGTDRINSVAPPKSAPSIWGVGVWQGMEKVHSWPIKQHTQNCRQQLSRLYGKTHVRFP